MKNIPSLNIWINIAAVNYSSLIVLVTLAYYLKRQIEASNQYSLNNTLLKMYVLSLDIIKKMNILLEYGETLCTAGHHLGNCIH
jgi:hypothetical protein